MDGAAHKGLLPARELEERAREGEVVRHDHLEVRVTIRGQGVQGLEVVDGKEYWKSRVKMEGELASIFEA